jgi:predicted transcriptional regulator
MEGLAALGVAANIFQFIEYGLKIVREAKRLKETQGTPNATLEQSTYQLKAIVQTIERQTPAKAPTEEQKVLASLSYECLTLSNELLELLETLKAQNPSSFRNRVRTILKNRYRAEEKQDLEARLEQCKDQLHLQLSSIAR